MVQYYFRWLMTHKWSVICDTTRDHRSRNPQDSYVVERWLPVSRQKLFYIERGHLVAVCRDPNK